MLKINFLIYRNLKLQFIFVLNVFRHMPNSYFNFSFYFYFTIRNPLSIGIRARIIKEYNRGTASKK
ncbi:hypothetical protein HZS_1890 [Henneguya salminicola]|nr:hypothetical protein HZS_1890 [Henneguya salminicola]